MQREVRVGLTVVVAVILLGLGVFAVGDRENLFSATNRYTVRFLNVAGLAAGNPVQLNGVNVGRVEEIVLPEKIEDTKLTVNLSIDRRYEARIRKDSIARIKTLGLLGDKYVEITSGSAEAPILESGGEIEAAPATDVDKLIASGEDVVENVMAISVSLRTILARMEAGEGLLGELTINTEGGRRAKEGIVAIVESLRQIVEEIETSDGSLARFVRDDSLMLRAETAFGRFDRLLSSMEAGDGTLPALIHDVETRDRIQQTVADLGSAASNFARVSDELAQGEGLLGRLISDEELSNELTEDLRRLIRNLSLVSDKIEQADGTLGQLIEDPQVYQALNDIIVGIDESKLLRWLVRNRQKKGIEVRYEETQPGTQPGAQPAGGEPSEQSSGDG